jgi:hypothetical protein
VAVGCHFLPQPITEQPDHGFVFTVFGNIHKPIAMGTVHVQIIELAQSA